MARRGHIKDCAKDDCDAIYPSRSCDCEAKNCTSERTTTTRDITCISI